MWLYTVLLREVRLVFWDGSMFAQKSQRLEKVKIENRANITYGAIITYY